MATDVIHVDPLGDFTDNVRDAAKVLADGGLVAFPTETVYGLGANASDADAVARLRSVKERAATTAFTVHIGEPKAVCEYVPRLNGLAGRLVRKAWPGPLTMILEVDDPADAPIMKRLDPTAGAAIYYEGTIGVRCPDDPIATALLRAVEHPVVAASANLAGGRSPETGDDVLSDLDGKIDLVIDAGRAKYARPSTIIKIHGRNYEVVRDGVYDARTIERLSALRILFICTGNTCRSPMATGIAGRVMAGRLGCEVDELPANGVVVCSAGTAGGFGGPTEHAVTVMRRRGIDISKHISRVVTAEMARGADHTFVMTRGHLESVQALAPIAVDQVALLLGDRDIADPIGGNEEDYEQCARSIEKGVEARLKEVIA